MKQAKLKSKNASILRNVIDHRPILPKEIRWFGKAQMLKRFNLIKAELQLQLQSALVKTTLDIDPQMLYGNKTRKFEEMLTEIDCVTKSSKPYYSSCLI